LEKKKKKKKKKTTNQPTDRIQDYNNVMNVYKFEIQNTYPASMIGLTFLPRGVPVVTAARNMSPVAKWHTLYFSLIKGACVPFPAPGGPVFIVN
jgi:hypothetical protein